MFLADRYIKGTCPKCGATNQFAGDGCEKCGTTNAPTDLVDPLSVITGATPELRPSEHLFFRLSDPDVVAFLERWTKETPLQPEVFNKIQEWLGASADDGGKALNDWDISREAPYFGIEMPDAPGKYFYVWLDAPIGYLAALKKHFDSGAARRAYPAETRSFEQFVADPAVEQYHFIGKDIVYFHTLFWPAMLRFSERKTPTNVFVHGFITALGEKMSKSRGTGISPQRYVDLGMNPEWLRYYIAAKLNDRVEDLDFNPDDFVARVNSDLIGKYVNIASRAATFIAKHFDGKLSLRAPATGQAGESPDSTTIAWGAKDAITEAYANREFGKVLREVMRIADRVNERFDQAKPWELAKDPASRARLHDVCSDALNAFRALTYYLAPVLPATTAAAARLFGITTPLAWRDIERAATTVAPYEHLMARIDPKQMDALLEPANAVPARVESAAATPPKAAARTPKAAAPAAADATTITIDDFTESTCASPASSTPNTSRARRSCSS